MMNRETTFLSYKLSHQGTSGKEKLRKSSVDWGRVTDSLPTQLHNKENLTFALAAFLLTKGVLFNFLSPFGFGFFAAVLRQKKDKTVPVFFCSCLALYLFFSFPQSLFFCLPFVVLFILNRFINLQKGGQAFYLSIIFFLAFVSRFLLFILGDRSLITLLAAFFDSCLIVFLAYIFEPVVRFLGDLKSLGKINGEEEVCFVFLAVGILIGTADLEFASLSLQNILSRYLILLRSLGGLGQGAAVGVVVGTVTLFTGQFNNSLVSLYTLSGLLGGVGKEFGKLGIILGFLTGNFLLSLYLTVDFLPLVFWIESGLACCLLLLTPSNLTRLISYPESSKKTMENKTELVVKPGLQALVVQKVAEMSRVLKELAEIYGQISADREQPEYSPATKILDALANKVCRSCSVSTICWEKDFYQTYQLLFELLTNKNAGNLTVEQVPINFKKRCSRIKKVVHTFNDLLETYNLNSYWESRMFESRELVSGQLKGIAQIMDSLIVDLEDNGLKQLELEKKVRNILKNNQIRFEQISVSGLDKKKFELTITRPSCLGSGECRKKMVPLISHSLGEVMYLQPKRCGLKNFGEMCCFKLYPSRPYQVEHGLAKAAKDSYSVSGDSFTALELKNGKYAFFLSDGMGCGPKAAKKSSAAISLLEQLMGLGFPQELAVRTANSILVLNSPEDSFATLDLLLLDLYSGEAELIKIGSAPSFLKRNCELKTINLNSLPIGILNNIEFCSVKQQVQDGDLVIMVSDGVLDARRDLINKEEWIEQSLQRIDSTDPKQVADYILERAVRYSGGRLEDDMTVVAVKITSGIG